MDEYQFAYRTKRSTQDALLCLTTTVTSFIDKKASNYARWLFLDFSSAFNTISIPDLLTQLTHLNSNITEWIYSFLTEYRHNSGWLTSNPIITNTWQHACHPQLVLK